MLGIENCREFFGRRSDKEALSAAFEAGPGDSNKNLLFGSSGIVTRTLDHWRDMLDEAFELIESLRAALLESRAETPKALAEKEKAESERVVAFTPTALKSNSSSGPTALKLDQTQAQLSTAQDLLNRMAKDREQAVKAAVSEAERTLGLLAAKNQILARLLSRSPGMTCLERLKARRTPLHPTGLTRSPSRAVNRAPRMHEARKAGRGIEATDFIAH